MGSRFNINKKVAIKASSMQDSILALNETNCVKSDASMLANTFGKNARVSDCSNLQYINGSRVILTGNARKASGFGTALIDKDNHLRLHECLREYIIINIPLKPICSKKCKLMNS